MRWAVVIAGIVAAVVAIARWRKAAEGKSRSGLIYIILLDLQLLGGVVLLLLTPWFATLTTSPGSAMKNDVLRYWTIEHGFGMLVAIAVAHVGRVLERKAADPRAGRKRVAIAFAISILIILITMPWPFMKYARPLLRM